MCPTARPNGPQSTAAVDWVKKLHGPIMIFGAGGFVGINLFNKLLSIRSDVIGVSSDLKNNWRIKANNINKKNLAEADLLNVQSIKRLINKYKPQTIFNLAAYGAYSKQQNIEKIYQTNFISTINLIETIKKYDFCAYLHAGTQSEYGLNCKGSREKDELIPNSHYAVSKTADYYLLKYYGKIEKLPVVHLRLYSVYGPWEEPTRLIPTLIKAARTGNLPKFVDVNISRDFVFVDDVVEAFIATAVKIKDEIYGEVFNVASGKKTTIKELAYLAKKLFKINKSPVFNTMKNRDWDLKDWYGNADKIQKIIGWQVRVELEQGLLKTFKFDSCLD